MLLVPLLLSLADAAIQAPSAAAPASMPAPIPTSRYRGRLFISPMGEPFRPNGRDDDTLADWFRQADRSHDGQVTLEEMQQDAERFFLVLDVNRDGEIDPDEITHYEEVVAPEIKVGAGYELTAASDVHQGGARFSLLDLPEPVVSADTNFNRGISLAEFRQAASQRFIALDVDHQGKLALAVLGNIRPAAAPGTNKVIRQRPTGDTSRP